MALTASYIDSDSFRIAGVDLTIAFHCGRRVILNLDGTYVESFVWKSEYTGGNTDVSIEEAIITSDLTQVEFGIGIGTTHQFPNHNHSNVEGDGGHREQRIIMEYVDSDTIKIHPGAYLLYSSDGKINRTMYNDTELTFDFGSGGSNASSDDLTADDIHYLSLDESVCKAQRSRKLTAGCFINHTAEPSKNNAKKQWLNENDRTIWAIPTNSSSEIRKFAQNAIEIAYRDTANLYDIAYNVDIDASFVTLTLPPTPVFVDTIFVTATLYNAGSILTASHLQVRATGSGDTAGVRQIVADGTVVSTNTFYTTCSPLQKIDVKLSATGTDTVYITMDGFRIGGYL